MAPFMKNIFPKCKSLCTNPVFTNALYKFNITCFSIFLTEAVGGSNSGPVLASFVDFLPGPCFDAWGFWGEAEVVLGC